MTSEMCPSCRVGFVFECWNPNPDTGMNCVGLDPFDVLARQGSMGEPGPDDNDEPKKVAGGQVKEDEEVGDVLSTGRKRAAQLFPLEEGMTCEWSGLLNAGGGVLPIVGCDGKPASARHHGPDKSTLNNEVGNVHRICVHCHNRWHSKNDEFYGERPGNGLPFIPLDHDRIRLHDPATKATAEQIAESEIAWLINRPKRAKEE